MAKENDIDPAGAAPVLRGLARELAAALRERAEAFIAQTAMGAEAEPVEHGMRKIAAIARAAAAVHTLQAAEDKAAARALEARIGRMAGAARAQPQTFDEGDETDMHDQDARLETPAGVVEVYQDARQGVGRVFRHLEHKRGHPAAGDAAGGVGGFDQLDHQGGGGAAPTH